MNAYSPVQHAQPAADRDAYLLLVRRLLIEWFDEAHASFEQREEATHDQEA